MDNSVIEGSNWSLNHLHAAEKNIKYMKSQNVKHILKNIVTRTHKR